ncbi:hypothetical protein K1719_046554 [Acacia pycnantha]|nr:hypothetical protein K1719_046554 [Acacia pycnantha]
MKTLRGLVEGTGRRRKVERFGFVTMSAVVCGSKRSFFEDIPLSPPVSKRLGCSSSPIRFSTLSLVDQLQVVFPQMEVQANNKNNNDDDNDCTNYTMLIGTCIFD